MNAPHCKVENGNIYWRGSAPSFSYLDPDDAVKLRAVFAEAAAKGDQGCDGYAAMCTTYVKALDAAIAKHENYHNRLEYAR